MKAVYIGYIFFALIILFVTFANFFKVQFLDVTDAKNILAGISLGLFGKVINLRIKINRLEINTNGIKRK